MMDNNWHIPDIDTLAEHFKTDLESGLSPKLARQRLEGERGKRKEGSYSLFVPRKKSFFSLLFAYVSSPYPAALLLVTLLSALFGDPVFGLSVLAVAMGALIIFGVLTVRAQRKLESVKNFASPTVRVLRGGNVLYIDGRNVVQGDVILLREGDLLPCDARIISCEGLEVNELIFVRGRVLSRKVEKTNVGICINGIEPSAPDAANMLYAGSAIERGSARAMAVACGSDVYLASYLEEGALGGKEGESAAVTRVLPLLHRMIFVSSVLLLLLSVIGLITLKEKQSFLYLFSTLLSCFVALSPIFLRSSSGIIFASYISWLSKEKNTKKRKLSSAHVRGVRAIDTLTGVTDIILMGAAGFTEGSLRIGGATVGREQVDLGNADRKNGRLLSLIHTYVKAQRDNVLDEAYSTHESCEALFYHLRSCGFDVDGADVSLKSLTYLADPRNGYGFAHAETNTEIFRVSLIPHKKALEMSDLIRDGEETRKINSSDVAYFEALYRDIYEKGGICLFVLCESDNKTILEGSVALRRVTDPSIENVLPELVEYGVRTVAFIYDEDSREAKLLQGNASLGKNIAYASEFAKKEIDVADSVGVFTAYVGFSEDDYLALVREMKARGRKVCSFAVDNRYNSLMAACDIAASCDVIDYSSDRYMKYSREKLPAEGRDISLRATCQTRLLSKVTVKRAGDAGGGIYAIFRAIKAARGAHVSFARSILLYLLLICPVFAFAAMNTLAGDVFLDPYLATLLSACVALLCATVFADSDHTDKALSPKLDYTAYSKALVRSRAPSAIARALSAILVAIGLRICGAVGLFGEHPSYKLPVVCCILISFAADIFMLSDPFSRKGQGRRRVLVKTGVAFGVTVALCAISLHGPFVKLFYPCGFGRAEFLAVPAFVLIYALCALIAFAIERKRRI